MDTLQTFIGMLYSHWIIITILALFFFNFAMLASADQELKTFRYVCIGLGSAVVIIFAVMPVPQFVQSKNAIQGYVAQKSNQDSMFYFKMGAADVCKDGLVLGFEFMNLNSKFTNDVDRIVKQKSSFSMDHSFFDSAPVSMVNGKNPICEFAKMS